MAVDHVRFCVRKHLTKHSHAFAAAEERSDLALLGAALVAAVGASATAGSVLGVQTTQTGLDDVKIVVTESGLVGPRFCAFAEIDQVVSHIDDKYTFRRIEIIMDDGSKCELDVDSGKGRMRDAYVASVRRSRVCCASGSDTRAYR